MTFIHVEAYGFDPFTIMAGSHMVETLTGPGQNPIEDAIDVGDSTTDLMSVSEISDEQVKEADSYVRRLEQINREAREAKYLEDEAKDLLQFDLSRSQSFASKLRHITSKIRSGKRLYGTLFNKGKVSNTVVQVEQVKLNYQILDELRGIRSTEFNTYLENKERQVKLQAYLEKVLEEENKSYRQKLSVMRAASSHQKGSL